MSIDQPIDKLKKEIKEAKERIDEYEGTIHAIWSFVNLATWDNFNRRYKDTAYHSLGRRMTTSQKNIITPDVVIQIGVEIGYVVEAKYSMPRDKKHWEDDVQQLIKYDDNLAGWWTEDQYLYQHNVVLLIEYGRSVSFRDYLVEWLNKTGLNFNNNFAIVEFTKSDNANPYYGFRKMHGNIQDEALSNRLYESVKVPREVIVSDFGHRKFYDSRPPIVEYTMVTLWMHVLPLFREGIEFSKKLNAYPIYINTDELTLEIQKLYGQINEDERSVEFPQLDWVIEALDELEKMGLARKLDKSKDGYDYIVLHKDLRVQDVLEYFIAHRKKRSSKKGKQLRLL